MAKKKSKTTRKEFVTLNVSPSTKAKWIKLKEYPEQALDSLLSKVADAELLKKKQ
jgi:hypothetical protein